MEKKDNKVEISEAYSKGLGFPITIQKIATWIPFKGLEIISNDDKYERRKLNGVRIKVATIYVSFLQTWFLREKKMQLLANLAPSVEIV